MKIILKETVENLGNVGDVVKVKLGYARNYLLPKGLAVVADPKNVKELEHNKRQMEYKRLKLAKDAESLKAKIEALSLVFTEKVGEEGKLFGSVTSMDIAEKMASAGVEIDRKKIQLADAIKTAGSHQVSVKLDAGVVATLKLSVEAAA